MLIYEPLLGRWSAASLALPLSLSPARRSIHPQRALHSHMQRSAVLKGAAPRGAGASLASLIGNHPLWEHPASLHAANAAPNFIERLTRS